MLHRVCIAGGGDGRRRGTLRGDELRAAGENVELVVDVVYLDGPQRAIASRIVFRSSQGCVGFLSESIENRLFQRSASLETFHAYEILTRALAARRL